MNWTVNEILSFFERRGVPNNTYSLYKDSDEAYCLIREGDEWLVYYSEKGRRNELGWGKTESQGLNVLKLFVLEGYQQL